MTFPYLESSLPIAFAHRGGTDGGENALAAFDAARRIGYTYIETDVRTTSDGVPVVFHDADLRRMTGQPQQIKELSGAEVAQVKINGTSGIPTLAEALTAFPEMRFNIDLKDSASVEAVADVLHRTSALSRVCITSFSDRRIDAARGLLGPGICTGMGVVGVLGFLGRSLWPGHVPHVGAAVLQVPLRWYGVPVVTARLIERAHDAGLVVHVWTLNDQASIHGALDAGVDGIMTDNLRLLKKILLERGLWTGSV